MMSEVTPTETKEGTQSTAPPAELPAADASKDTATPQATTPQLLSPEDEDAPAKPPRPTSPMSMNQAALQEAFPSIDAAVVRAVLLASSGDVNKALAALLTMSDPSYAEEEPPPPPPRPRAQAPSPGLPRQGGPGGSLPAEYLTSTPQSQLDADALYARQLADQYGPPRPRREAGTVPRDPRRRQEQYVREDDDDYYYDSDKEHSFFDDDLPVIKENIRKGFQETQTKFNSWITDFKKKIDGDSPETSPPSTASGSQYARTGSRRTPTGFPEEKRGRGSGDLRYDADPRVLSDDFAHLELRDNTGDTPSRRPKANPNLFQPSPISKSPGGRKVSFEDRTTTINDDELYRPGSTGPARQPSPNTTNSKWEPLKSVDPAPMDPFSLGDSDDEKDGLVKEGEPVKTVSSITGPQESGTTKKE